MSLERISIELTNQCPKACSFCYNHSGPQGHTAWSVDELVDFVSDCARSGVKAVSFGGGEPLVYPGLFEVLTALQGKLFRSLTTSGWRLDDYLDRLVAAAPDKVHVSIHFPQHAAEVTHVIGLVYQLEQAGLRSGVNFLVDREQLPSAAVAAQQVREAGIVNERIVYLPMRGMNTPTPRQVATVAGDTPFQSTSCLHACGKSPRFCSISWDRQVAWCSYTRTRARLRELSYAGLTAALEGLGLEFCGGTK